MNLRKLLIAVAAASTLLPAVAQAGGPITRGIAAWGARRNAWHGNYANAEYGGPVALAVPPTAERQTSWGWGVTNTEVRPIWHQYRRPYPGPIGGFGEFAPTPAWPSHTDQFGVYYIRSPW